MQKCNWCRCHFHKNNKKMNTQSAAQKKQKRNQTAAQKHRVRKDVREREVEYAKARRKAKKEQLLEQTLLINEQEVTIKQLQLAVQALQQTVHKLQEQHIHSVQRDHTSDTDSDSDQTTLYSDSDLTNPCCNSSIDSSEYLHKQNNNTNMLEEVSIQDRMHAQLLASNTENTNLLLLLQQQTAQQMTQTIDIPIDNKHTFVTTFLSNCMSTNRQCRPGLDSKNKPCKTYTTG